MTNIIVRLQVEGLHFWLGATELPEVEYLAYAHRHMFYIECKKEVTHDDRDIEFIMFKHKIYNYLITEYYDAKYDSLYFGQQSCEMIANELVNKFKLNYCSVFEDNENGAEVIK